MKRLLKKLEFWFDYYIGYLMTSDRKRNNYYEYFKEKWKDKF